LLTLLILAPLILTIIALGVAIWMALTGKFTRNSAVQAMTSEPGTSAPKQAALNRWLNGSGSQRINPVFVVAAIILTGLVIGAMFGSPGFVELFVIAGVFALIMWGITSWRAKLRARSDVPKSDA
jgi:hypothetical protein